MAGSNPTMAAGSQSSPPTDARKTSVKTISVKSSRRGSRRALASQESSRRRSAAASLRMSSAVLTIGLSVTARGPTAAGGAGAMPAPPAAISGPDVRVDVDVVDRPGSTGVLRVQHDLDRRGLVAVPQPQHAAERDRRRGMPRRVAGGDRANRRLVGDAVGALVAQLD